MDKSYWDLGSIKNPIYRNLEGGHSNGEQHRKYCGNRERRTGLIQGALDLQDTQAQLTWKRLRSLRVAPVGRQRVSLRVSATGSVGVQVLACLVIRWIGDRRLVKFVSTLLLPSPRTDMGQLQYVRCVSEGAQCSFDELGLRRSLEWGRSDDTSLYTMNTLRLE
jgi:hypothetical protein